MMLGSGRSAPQFLARFLCLALMVVLAACSTTQEVLQTATPPPPLNSDKYAAIIVDGNSGRTLYQVNANAQRYPASLTKMMTVFMLFEALEAGRVSRSTEMPVSAHAASQAPSKLGLRRGSTISVDSAIDALTVKSANDVAATVGEFLGGGSEERFAAMMTAKARQLGMTNTVFRNASGLPDNGQYTTARDMAVLGMMLRKRFPQHYGEFSKRSFVFNGRTINGHNRLLGRVEGVDGLKTGYIRASGFNIVTTVGRRGKRLVIVVMGGKTGRERDAHVEEMIERYLPLPGGTRTVVTQPAPAVEEEEPGIGAPGPVALQAPAPVGVQAQSVAPLAGVAPQTTGPANAAGAQVLRPPLPEQGLDGDTFDATAE